MGLETATTISGLNRLWPLGTDGKNEGDDHLRLIKTVLQMQYAGDLFFGQRVTPDRWVWNDKADGTGTDVATMSEAGNFVLIGSAAAASLSVTNGPFINQDADYNNWINAPQHFWRYTKLTGLLEYFYANSVMLAVNSTHVRLPRGATFTASDAFGVSENAGAYYINYGTGYFLQNDPNGHWNIYQQNQLRLQVNNSDGSLRVTMDSPFKPTGGPWIGGSDQRIKNILGDYASGLAEILALNPKRFTYKGNDTSEAPAHAPDPAANPDVKPAELPLTVPYPNSLHYQVAIAGTECVGLIVQEMEAAGVFPEMIKKRAGYIDGEPVTDLRDIDTGPLVYALINAVKELAARVDELEGVIVP